MVCMIVCIKESCFKLLVSRWEGGFCASRVAAARVCRLPVCVVSSHIICRSTMSQFHISALESPGIIILDSASLSISCWLSLSPLRSCFSRVDFLCSVIINSLPVICQLKKQKNSRRLCNHLGCVPSEKKYEKMF